MREQDERMMLDRRRQPTPGLSRYIFFGRRETLRRRTEQVKGGYIDRYSPGTLFLVILILGLNLLDAWFTMMILEPRGVELNPVVAAVMTVHGSNFWIWKFSIVSLSLVLLCLHSKFGRIKALLLGICALYIVVVGYEIVLIIYYP